MTENLLQKLEERMMMMLAEVEDLRKDISRLNHENASLKMERDTNTRKLQDLISLLDSVNVVENVVTATNINSTTVKPVLLQDIQEIAL